MHGFFMFTFLVKIVYVFEVWFHGTVGELPIPPEHGQAQISCSVRRKGRAFSRWRLLLEGSATATAAQEQPSYLNMQRTQI